MYKITKIHWSFIKVQLSLHSLRDKQAYIQMQNYTHSMVPTSMPNVPSESSVLLSYLGLALYRTIRQNTHPFVLKHTPVAQHLEQ